MKDIYSWHNCVRIECVSAPGSKNISLSVVYHSVYELKLDTHNPRATLEKEIQQIARSIDAFDFNVPDIVDEHLK